MKTLCKYIQESFDVPPEKPIDLNDYCIVEVFDIMFDTFLYQYNSVMLPGLNSDASNLFLLTKGEASQYDGNINVKIHQIPSKYDSVNKIENDCKNGTIMQYLD